MLALLLMVQFGLVATPLVTNSQSSQRPCEPSELTVSDAEILVYLLPDSVATRDRGRKVGWELQTGVQLDQKDFFVFYVYDVTAPQDSSPTIGYFGVNKHTAEVWDMNREEFVQAKDLLAVQGILRKGHCIAEELLKTYSSKRPDMRLK